MSLTKADDKVTNVALPLGSLVRYYDEGWRAGHLEKITDKGKIAKIRPIAAYKANPRCVRIPVADVVMEKQ